MNGNNDNKVDIITLHGGWINRFNDFEAGFRKRSPKPYLFSEPVPSWRGTSDFLDTIRRSVWEVTLAGANWVSQNDTSFGWDSNTKMATKIALRDKAYDYVGFCSKFFNNFDVNLSEIAGVLCNPVL